ncbi:MAG: hypothetical protein EZS28_039659 [Streblomastix strix]|uniref:Uncharacterized protein n=1 Tax=Streblomastix strix TaxID=222440 RepID=A0A5J4U356_9EUKA|nr:MAG: hypothetical protein EZS28_039659 [Streblomastix strix]
MSSAVTALAKLVDKTLVTVDIYNLQLHAYHIPDAQSHKFDIEVDNRGKMRSCVDFGRENEKGKKTSTARTDNSSVFIGNEGEELFR